MLASRKHTVEVLPHEPLVLVGLRTGTEAELDAAAGDVDVDGMFHIGMRGFLALESCGRRHVLVQVYGTQLASGGSWRNRSNFHGLECRRVGMDQVDYIWLVVRDATVVDDVDYDGDGDNAAAADGVVVVAGGLVVVAAVE